MSNVVKVFDDYKVARGTSLGYVVRNEAIKLGKINDDLTCCFELFKAKDEYFFAAQMGNRSFEHFAEGYASAGELREATGRYLVDQLAKHGGRPIVAFCYTMAEGGLNEEDINDFGNV